MIVTITWRFSVLSSLLLTQELILIKEVIPITTFYTGYRPVLQGDDVNDWVNTYTHKLGVYSNWQLMSSVQPLQGAPDNYRVPGGGAFVPGARVYGEGDVYMSRVFLGLETPWKNSLKGAQNPVQNDFYGRYIPDLYRGLLSTKVFSAGYGHTSYNEVTGTGGGPNAAYALWSNYFWVGVGNNKALDTATLGHIERYPKDTINTGSLGIYNQPTGQAESFGAFEPYLYKGVYTTKSAPMSNIANQGHPYWPPSVTADPVPQDYGQIPAPRSQPDHYGDEHTREWFGVTSAKALDV